MIVLHVHPLVRRLVERLERVEVRRRVARIVLVQEVPRGDDARRHVVETHL